MVTPGLTFANQVEWEISSPTPTGVELMGANYVFLGETDDLDYQHSGIYGVGLHAKYGGDLLSILNLSTLDSWNNENGYFDRFLVTVSNKNFFWEDVDSQEIIFEFGGYSWSDSVSDNYKGTLMSFLGPNSYISFLLETKGNPLKQSFGYIGFIFTPAAETSPVPEPTTMLLFGTGLVGLSAMSRRKKA